MQILIIIVSILLSIFSTAVMSYITMATPIGPWIEPTLVLLATVIFRFAFKFISSKNSFNLAYNNNSYNKALGLATASGAIGGILATGFGFAFPTLYFLDKDLFNSWLSNPAYFMCIVTSLAFISGSIAFLAAEIFEKELLIEQQMPFAVGQMVHKMITAQNQVKKAWELVAGIISTISILAFQKFSKLISNTIILWPKTNLMGINFPACFLRIDQAPMLIAIGFITGHVITQPLIVGLISRLFLVNPLHQFYFNGISVEDFMMAFCSGMVLYGAIMSLIDLPKTLKSALKGFGKNKTGENNSQSSKLNNFKTFNFFADILNKVSLVQVSYILVFAILFFSYFNFSFLSQIYLISFTFICAYQLMTIAGKMGIAPVARFATFVMVPGMIIFGFNAVQVTLVSVFVECCGGIASDLMFGRKMAQLVGIERKEVVYYQWLGLLISSLSLGIILWLLITNFGLGSDQLFAQKAQGRALLINFKNFNYYALIIGALFGFLLKFTKVNPVMVLGGILMPIDYSLMLISGGLLTYAFKDKEELYPFWSGVFASNSIWMFISTLL